MAESIFFNGIYTKKIFVKVIILRQQIGSINQQRGFAAAYRIRTVKLQLTAYLWYLGYMFKMLTRLALNGGACRWPENCSALSFGSLLLAMKLASTSLAIARL